MNTTIEKQPDNIVKVDIENKKISINVLEGML